MADDLPRFVVQLPDGDVTLLPRRAPLGHSSLIRGRTLAVVALAGTTWDEGAARLPDGMRAFHATILPGERPAIAVTDLTEAEAIGLGQTLGADEILYWDGRRGRMVACA
jgi:hypothetical protein